MQGLQAYPYTKPYHAINRLSKAGFIQAVASGRKGRRPERTTYRITKEGQLELIHALRQMVGVPRRESSEFMAAMSFHIHLEQDNAISRLEERVQRLEKEIQQTEATMKMALAHVQRIHLIESEYMIAMRRAELKWVRDLLYELHSGRLALDLKKSSKIFDRVKRKLPHLRRNER
jgi:DNA-binding PadR family transcriptional regulator